MKKAIIRMGMIIMVVMLSFSLIACGATSNSSMQKEISDWLNDDGSINTSAISTADGVEIDEDTLNNFFNYDSSADINSLYDLYMATGDYYIYCAMEEDGMLAAMEVIKDENKVMMTISMGDVSLATTLVVEESKAIMYLSAEGMEILYSGAGLSFDDNWYYMESELDEMEMDLIGTEVWTDVTAGDDNIYTFESDYNTASVKFLSSTTCSLEVDGMTMLYVFDDMTVSVPSNATDMSTLFTELD